LGVEDLAGRVGLAVLIAVVHEVPDAARLFSEVRAALRPGGRVLLLEPAGHVGAGAFATTVARAGEAGLRLVERVELKRSHGALLVRD
jgi:SAM-dependent methyltransferase